MNDRRVWTDRRRWTTFLTPAIVVILLDLVSKVVVSRTLGPEASRSSIEIIPGILEFDYASNSGIAFGLLSGGSALVWVAVAAGLGLGGWLVYSTFLTATRGMLFAYGLIGGGALANVVNRLYSGYVIDFIEIGRWPSFNIADSMLTIGLILVIAVQLREEPDTMTERSGG